MAVYLDCNATTPVEPEVLQAVLDCMRDECGNEGSWTHTFGTRARQRVDAARLQVADVVGARPDEVIFTSGATESSNLALLGLARFGERRKRKHIITTSIEHKAVLGPLSVLERQGFETTYLPPDSDGQVSPEALRQALREDTLLVSVMHVNNETGVVQPLDRFVEILRDHQAYFHVDAAQGYGKELAMLRSERIDLISVSGHKLYATQGIGALIVRKRGGVLSAPLQPIIYGGGQQQGLRPGTLPVPLIVGLGLAARMALADHRERMSCCHEFKKLALDSLAPLGPIIHGNQEAVLHTTLLLSFPGLDSKSVIEATSEVV